MFVILLGVIFHVQTVRAACVLEPDDRVLVLPQNPCAILGMSLTTRRQALCKNVVVRVPAL